MTYGEKVLDYDASERSLRLSHHFHAQYKAGHVYASRATSDQETTGRINHVARPKAELVLWTESGAQATDDHDNEAGQHDRSSAKSVLFTNKKSITSVVKF